MAVTVHHLLGPRAFHDVAGRFDEFAQRLNLPITARRRWLQVWIDTHVDWEPWLILIQDGESVAAVAPLARRRRGPLLEVVMLGDGPSDDMRLPVSSSEFAHDLAKQIL